MSEATETAVDMLAAALAETWEHIERLRTALDAVLGLAADWQQEAAALDDKAELDGDTARSAHLYVRAQGCQDHATALREAIYRAFPGEDKADV